MRAAFRWIAAVWIILATSARGEVWYERKLSEMEKNHYTTAYNEWGLGESEEKLRKQWQSYDWGRNWKTIKVELLYNESAKPPRPYIKETVLSADVVALAECKKWREERGPHLTDGIEIPGFKRVSKLAENFGPMYTIQYDGNESIGCLSEEYRGPKGQTAAVSIYEGTGRIPEVRDLLHEMLRTTIRCEHSVKGTQFGTVVPYKTKWGKTHKVSYVTWTAPKSFIINIGAQGVDPMEIARVFGKKFPSSLPADLKIDKTAWGREEFELGLRRSKAALEDRIHRRGTLDGQLGRATEYVYCSLDWRSQLGNPYLETREVCIAKNRKVYDEITRWWQENKNQTYWDEKVNMLVAKGQTPADIKAETDRRAKEAGKEH